jgi:hypothetical protein
VRNFDWLPFTPPLIASPVLHEYTGARGRDTDLTHGLIYTGASVAGQRSGAKRLAEEEAAAGQGSSDG